MAVYDCFTFFNELDILEIRLNELDSVADTFVLVEAAWTHQGAPKPLYFEENKQRFARFLPKIRHIILTDTIETEDPWVREKFQRDSIRQGLKDAAPSDLFMVSDVDEIIRPSAVLEAAKTGAFCLFDQTMHYYYIDYFAPDAFWVYSYAAPISYIDKMDSLNEPRSGDRGAFLKRLGEEGRVIEHAGWHLTWLGGEERIVTKLLAYAHTEEKYQKWRSADALRKLIRDKRFFVDNAQLSLVKFDTLPKYVQAAGEALFQNGFLSAPPTALWRAPAQLYDRVRLHRRYEKGRRRRQSYLRDW
ncbi:MAG: hypothetical protein ABW199_12995 [Caulobacterales bacterium]